jgi:hypothetical protein
MRIGGWLRLWIVLGVLYGTATALVAFDARPTAENIRRDWITDGLNIIAVRVTEKERVQVRPQDIANLVQKRDPSPDAIFRYFEQIEKRPKLSQVIFLDDIKATNARYRSKLAGLPQQQRTYFFNAVLAWLAPLLMVLAFGYASRWVWRGFHHKEV